MTQQTQALVKSGAQAALDEVQVDPRLVMAAKAIQLMAGQDDKGNPKISADMALAAAMYQAGTGQLLGRDFYVNEKIGRMEGYRGVSRDAMDRGVGEVQIKYRPLTSQECEDHEIQAGDTAVVCEVYQLRAWQLAQKMGQAYEPISGVGVVRKVEKYDKKTTQRWNDNAKRYEPLPESGWKFLNLEGGMTWRKKAQNRAYKEALRHVPGAAASAAEVLEEATLGGMTHHPPEAARLSVDQALEWARQNAPRDDIEEGEFTAEDAAATLATNNARQRGTSQDWQGFGDDDNAAADQRAINDAAFEALPSASAERAGNNGKSTPPAKRPQWKTADEAIDWGNEQGCFDHRKHAENAFNLVVTGLKETTEHPKFGDVFNAWYADVLRRVADKLSKSLDAQAAAETPHF